MELPKIKTNPFGLVLIFGGATRNRTGDEGFADLCLTAWLWRLMSHTQKYMLYI